MTGPNPTTPTTPALSPPDLAAAARLEASKLIRRDRAKRRFLESLLGLCVALAAAATYFAIPRVFIAEAGAYDSRQAASRPSDMTAIREKISRGDPAEDVRRVMGDPDRTQTMDSQAGYTQFWYYSVDGQMVQFVLQPAEGSEDKGLYVTGINDY